ncbi:uncharacterized protein LOC129761356 [Toxorhynchites rutilus septentrionalis]|uniref:uncharacterized protein LOC129761356 n=1 Tax=Toxorhynchites rutilus septentrionalis TaxID=329112 RepID=UPI00247A1B9A|nr:uncharacterized protein LOC129761356 [Toxorhynchites rutilus septentrionalis]
MSRPSPNPNPDQTGYSCAACDRPDSAEKEMVLCDRCQLWYHFGCAGVSDDIHDVSWRCTECRNDEENDAALQEEIKKFEEDKKIQKQKMEREKILHRKRLEMQQEMFEMRQQLEKEKRELEKAQMQKKLSEEEAHQKKLKEMRIEMEEKLRRLKLKRNKDADEDPKKKKEKKKCKSVEEEKEISESDGSEKEDESLDDSVEEEESEDGDSSETGEEEVNENNQRRRRHRHKSPTKAQLSSRQFLSRKLPTFSGQLEEWPLFISSYETSTKACGFSNIENLARLQECLKGEALEVVRSRLLLPKAVPKIIETLRMLFGRPEALLNMLLMKIRNAPPPKADRLASFISFGVVVQQLTNHLEATGLTTHLMNPMLIQELTEKLPAGTKMEWVRYRRRNAVVTLRTLSDFLSDIGKDASEATSFGEAAVIVDHRQQKGKSKRGSEGFLHAHCETEKNQGPSGRERTPCRICGRFDHRVRNCDKFRKLRLADRWEVVRRWNLCQLCLNEHGNFRCKLNLRCNVDGCNERHNPLLHQERSICNIHATLPKPSVIFRMIPVKLYRGQLSVNTIAFLDEGSSYTLVEKSLISKLGVGAVTQPLRVTWTAGVSRVKKDSRRVELFISARGSTQRFHIKSAHTVESLKLPPHTLPMSEIVKQHEHLRGLPIADFQQATPQILIGLKDIHLYAPIESRIGRPGEPIAVRSKLGWTVYGPTGTAEMDAGIVGKTYTLEESGISAALLPESVEDRRAKEILEKTTVRVGDRFETGLLWKEDDPSFPDSYPMAVKRMQSMERRLQKDAKLYEKVRCMIGEYLAKGYAHIATRSELKAFDYSKVWYIPLNIVFNPRKQKHRLVWDARAEVKGISLKSKLLKGPDMLTALPAVLCRFRERAIGFGANIKEMYHQMRIREVDKRVMRFVFRNDPSMAPVVYVMDVATFGATCSPSLAQYVKNLNAKEYAGQFPEAAKAIVENHYVDEYFDSADTIEEAVKRARDVRGLSQGHGGELELGSERVLGIVWSPTCDEFMFSTRLRDDLLPYLSGDLLPSKRVVMSCVMSFFDPLGLLSIFTFYGKLLIQDLWRSGCDWEQQIDRECADRWNQWICRLPDVEEVRVPRFYFHGGHIGRTEYSSIQLHVFVDASEIAYGAAEYLRIETVNGPLCSLVMSRSKVAPLKHLSIPRLELQAAVLGARLANSVEEILSLEINQRHIWSDSKTVLSWIHSDHRRYKQFVAFRIGEILNLTKLGEWHWVPTKCNVADAMTKWEKRRKRDGLSIEVIPATSRVKKLVKRDLITKITPLKREEYQVAEAYLWRAAQAEEFADEVKVLKKNRSLPYKDWRPVEKCSHIYDLSPFLDKQDVLRMEGRAARGSSLPFELRFPIILPKKHPVTDKLLEYYHQQVVHGNTETAVNEIRQRFRIQNLRAEMKRICRTCVWSENDMSACSPACLQEPFTSKSLIA